MSDVYHFWTKGQIPSVYFGPGKIELAHVSDEYIDLHEIHDATRIYLDIALRILAPDVDRAAARAEIDVEAAVRLTRDLVRFPSENPPGDQREIMAFFKSWFERHGIPYAEYAKVEHLPCLVAEIGDPEAGPTLHFNGHSDVVPAGDGWTYDPYAADIVDGKMYGRGTCDMKAGIASFLTVAAYLVEKKIPLRGRLQMSIVPDEETGGDFGSGFLVGEGIIKPDFAIIAEPSSMQMSITENALLWLMVRTEGDRVHTINSVGAVNAVEDMADVIQGFKALRREFAGFRHPSLGGVVMTVNVVNGGIKTNIVPDECVAHVDCRFPAASGLTIADMLAKVDAMLDRIRAENPTIRVSYTYHGKDAFRQPPDTDIVRFINESMLEVTGKPAAWLRTDLELDRSDAKGR